LYYNITLVCAVFAIALSFYLTCFCVYFAHCFILNINSFLYFHYFIVFEIILQCIKMQYTYSTILPKIVCVLNI